MKANSWNIAGEEGHQTSQCFPTHFPAKFLLPTELTVVVLATAGLACVDWRGWRVWGSADGQQAGALTMATASTGLFAGEESRGLRPVLLFSRRHNGLNVNTTMRRRGGGGGRVATNMTTNLVQLQWRNDKAFRLIKNSFPMSIKWHGLAHNINIARGS